MSDSDNSSDNDELFFHEGWVDLIQQHDNFISDNNTPDIDESIGRELLDKFRIEFHNSKVRGVVDDETYPYSINYAYTRDDYVADLKLYFDEGLNFKWSDVDILTIIFIRNSKDDPNIGHTHFNALRQFFIKEDDFLTLALLDSVILMLKENMSFCDRVINYGDKLKYHFP